MRKLYALAAISVFALTLATGCAPKQEETTPATTTEEAAPAPETTPAAPADTSMGATSDTTSSM